MARIEVSSNRGRAVLDLEGHGLSIGSADSNDIVIEGDRTVARLHAVLAPIAGGWCVQDLGSRSGTTVNGRRVLGAQHLVDGDEVRLGSTVVVYRGDGDLDRAPTTEAPSDVPELTPRERDVLVALCRPLVDRDVFTLPASINHIADELRVSPAAVKQHLARLADKFGIEARGEQRRAELANEAVRRGAIDPRDLAEPVA